MNKQLKLVLSTVNQILMTENTSKNKPITAHQLTHQLEACGTDRAEVNYLFGIYIHLAKDGYIDASNNKALLLDDSIYIYGLTEQAQRLLTPLYKRKSFWKKFPMIIISMFMLGSVLYHLGQNM